MKNLPQIKTKRERLSKQELTGLQMLNPHNLSEISFQKNQFNQKTFNSNIESFKGHNIQQLTTENRVEQHIALYICVMLTFLLLPLTNTFQLIQSQDPNYLHIAFGVQGAVIIFSIFIYILNSFKLVQGKYYEMLMYYVMMDGLQATTFAVIVIQTTLYFVQDTIQSYILIVLQFILSIILSGNFRVMVIFCKWERWQVIMFKLVLIISCVFYVFMGTYIFSSFIQKQDTADYKTRKKVEFTVLFACSYFQYYFGLIGKLSDYDGTSDLVPRYILIDPEEDEKQQENQNQNQNTSLKIIQNVKKEQNNQDKFKKLQGTIETITQSKKSKFFNSNQVANSYQ